MRGEVVKSVKLLKFQRLLAVYKEYFFANFVDFAKKITYNETAKGV